MIPPSTTNSGHGSPASSSSTSGAVETKVRKSPFKTIKGEAQVVEMKKGKGRLVISEVDGIQTHFDSTTTVKKLKEELRKKGRQLEDVIEAITGFVVPDDYLVCCLRGIRFILDHQLYVFTFRGLLPMKHWVKYVLTDGPRSDPVTGPIQSVEELHTLYETLHKLSPRKALTRPHRNRLLVALRFIRNRQEYFNAVEAKPPAVCRHHNLVWPDDLKTEIHILEVQPASISTNTRDRKDRLLNILQHGWELCSETFK